MTTKIEWVRGADGSPGQTWNPTLGCSKVGDPDEGECSRCYAISVAHRGLTPAHQGLTIKRPGERVDWTGEVRCLPERLDVPLRRQQPTTYFVDSMSDLFHPGVPSEFIADVFAVMALTPRHTYQILTKRPQRMAKLLGDTDRWLAMLDAALARRGGPLFAQLVPASQYPPSWWWLGASIGEGKYTFRADYVRATPAAIRWLSLEPLLSALPDLDLTDISWIVVGGESGSRARPMNPEWVEEIRDQCVAAGVPLFVKQWGEYGPFPPGWPAPADAASLKRARKVHVAVAYDGRFWPVDELAFEYDSPEEAARAPGDRLFHYVHETGRQLAREASGGKLRLHGMYKVGKKEAGRELDGVVWDQMPARSA